MQKLLNNLICKTKIMMIKMKKITYLLIFVFAASVSFAQMPPASKPDLQLTEEEAALRIQDYQAKVNDLQTKLDKLNEKAAGLEQDLQNTVNNLQDCREATKKLLGYNDADLEAFRQKLGQIEGKVREMKGLSNDELADRRDEVVALEAQLNELRGNKISLIPEFYNKIIYLAKEIKGLYREKKIRSYTVGTWAEDRDCLWNISGKMEIYADPMQWPKIWQANKDIIRNPDIIHPGQVLTLPPKGPKTEDEIKAERRYWRQKREAMEANTGEATAGN